MLKGSPAAYNALGVMYHNGQHIPVDYATARQMFEAGALLGDVDSMFNLGTLHLAGHGVEKDAAAALKYFQDANDNQHWQAPYQVRKEPSALVRACEITRYRNNIPQRDLCARSVE